MLFRSGQPWSYYTGPPDRYIVWGPFEAELYKWFNFRWRYLIYSRFAERDSHYRDYWREQRNGWVDRIVVNKLAYLWPPPPKYIEDQRKNLLCRGYANKIKYANGESEWTIPIKKPWTGTSDSGGLMGWFDGPNMQIDPHPSKDYYLEDGVNTTSNDLVLRLEDLGDGTTQVTYIAQATANWVYDVLDSDGNIILAGLGQGPNGRRVGNYFTVTPTPPYQIQIGRAHV